MIKRTCNEYGLLLLCCANEVDMIVAHSVCTITNIRHTLTILIVLLSDSRSFDLKK